MTEIARQATVLHELTGAQAASLIRSREISPVELVEALFRLAIKQATKLQSSTKMYLAYSGLYRLFGWYCRLLARR